VRVLSRTRNAPTRCTNVPFSRADQIAVLREVVADTARAHRHIPLMRTRVAARSSMSGRVQTRNAHPAPRAGAADDCHTNDSRYPPFAAGVRELALEQMTTLRVTASSPPSIVLRPCVAARRRWVAHGVGRRGWATCGRETVVAIPTSGGVVDERARPWSRRSPWAFQAWNVGRKALAYTLRRFEWPPNASRLSPPDPVRQAGAQTDNALFVPARSSPPSAATCPRAAARVWR
jgi:hypothetical protein